MSLFQRAAAMLREVMGDNADLAAELDAAHASSAATLPGPGRRVVISSGAPSDGYLVEIHNGSQFYAYGIQADSEADALAEAQKRFEAEPQEEKTAPEPEAPPQPDPQPITPPAPPTPEMPNASDPHAVDVTRGRDSAPVPAPELTEAHLGHVEPERAN